MPETLNNPNLLLIGNTHSNPSAKTFLAKLARIAREVGGNIYFVTADFPPTLPGVHWIPTSAGKSSRVPTRYVLFAKCQLGICLILVRMRAKFDQSIVLAAAFSLPVVLLRAMGKRVLVYVDGRPPELLTSVFCKFSFAFAKVLLVETKGLLDFWGVRSREKARSCGLYVDAARFVATRDLALRPPTVGFFGNLNLNKGVREMLGAIRVLNEKGEALKFIIGGSGDLEEEVKRSSSDCPNIDFRGQIASTAMPAALNECKLIVVPSRTEGLPNIVLEAMACGTPVLAAAVGGIPDIITDGENGFLLPNNTPECIADNILRSLRNPSLRRVADNASDRVGSEFTFEKAVDRYRRVFRSPETA